MSSPAQSTATANPGHEDVLTELFEAQGIMKQLADNLNSLDKTLLRLSVVLDCTVKKRKKKSTKNSYFVESHPSAILKFT
jgi:hypothetical protein